MQPHSRCQRYSKARACRAVSTRRVRRTIVRDAFAPRYIAQLEPRVEAVAAELLHRLALRDTADLVADYALPLPLISEILGVPERDRLRFRRWVTPLLALSTSSGPDLRLLLKLPGILAMTRFLRRLIAERRIHPRDDLVSQLAGANEDGDRLSEDELLAMVVILLIAGYETTVNLIATGTLLLLHDPGQLADLRAHPDKVGPAIEEILRLATPIDVATERHTREDVEIAGVTIPKGALVLVGIASANVDAARFSDPERLDLARTDNRHLSFGLGPHYCLGAPLARLEGRVAISALLNRFPDVRVSVPLEQLHLRPGMSLRGLTSLPVTLSSS